MAQPLRALVLVVWVCVLWVSATASIRRSQPRSTACLTQDGVDLIRSFEAAPNYEQLLGVLRDRSVPCVRRLLTTDSLSDNQFSALVSVAYNVGVCVSCFRYFTMTSNPHCDPPFPPFDRSAGRWPRLGS